MAQPGKDSGIPGGFSQDFEGSEIREDLFPLFFGRTMQTGILFKS